MSTTQRSFHISDVLSVTTERLVSTRHIDGIYDILGFMTDSQPFTHSLPRLNDECKPFLLAEHPELAEIEVPEHFDGATNEEKKASVNAWLETIYPTYGTEILVSRIPAEAHTSIDPIRELAMMVGKDRVIVVNTENLP
jgi:hypothetical protein